MFDKQKLPCHAAVSDENIISGNSSLPDKAPLLM